MKYAWEFVKNTLVGGLLIVVPIYLAVLLLLKAMQSVMGLVRPLAQLLPAWLPADNIFAAPGVESLFPHRSCRPRPNGASAAGASGAVVVRTHPRLRPLSEFDPTTGRRESRERGQPALAEIEDALVPAFIIEELEDGRFTVFVPSIPTPLAGAVYVLSQERVHPLDVPFTQAIQTVSR